MLWSVEDDGNVLVRLKSTEGSAQMLTRESVNRYIANIVGDLQVTLGVEIVTNELRIRFRKNSTEINVFWSAEVPAESVTDVREYMVTMSQQAPGG